MKPVFVDTNIFLRFLTRDDPSKYERCREIFEKALEGRMELVTSCMVIAELVWTLLSFYKVPKADLIEKLMIIVGTPSLHIPEKDLIVEALVLYSRKNVDYIDAWNATFMKHHGLEKLYSYDIHFDRIEIVHREEP